MHTQSRSLSLRRSQGGFTLTEVLVASFIFTVIVLAALMIYDRSNRIFKTAVESGDMQQNTRVGFDRLVADVRMTGFDYDRDGVPTRSASNYWQAETTYAAGVIVAPVTPTGFSYEAVTGGTSGAIEPNNWPTTAGATLTGDGTVTWRALGAVYQQPDEQIEFAGRSAIVIRANFDYNDTSTENHGEADEDYSPDGGQFPIITTSNDEIVIYALKSDAGPNNDTLSFYADVDIPRSAYPEGSVEDAVELGSIDLCSSGCNNPPYTLYRWTLDNDGAPANMTPIANNIRDLEFKFYTDLAGTTLLAKADGTAVANGAIGGDGQYDPDDPGATTNYDYRTQRALIVAIDAKLTGMSGAPDPGYTNPNETLTAYKSYRNYTLQSHITPRNLGLAGMAEPSGVAPGAATITSVCTGSCSVTRVAWSPPLSGNVQTYQVWYDPDEAFDDSPDPELGIAIPGDVHSAPIMSLTAGTEYFFKVKSINENGESWSTNVMSGTPINQTDPEAVTDLAATSGAQAEGNQITLSWTAPDENVDPLDVLACDGDTVSGADIDAAEPIRYRIWRGTSETFNPTASEGEAILDSSIGTQPSGSPGSNVTWVDNASNGISRPPANCKSYWYRIQVFDTCSISDATAVGPPALNDPADADTGTSAWYPDVSGVTPADAIAGEASSTIAPAAPGQPSIDYTNNNSECIKTPDNLCDVKILVPKVTTDTNNPTNTITVDQYRVKREKKKAADSAYVFDTYLSVYENASSDSSMVEGGNVVLHDETALDHDTDQLKWYYRYTVYALQCGTESAASPTVDFPESCGLASSVVVAAGESGGDGSAASPWVMNDGDTMTVTPPDGVTLNAVYFEIFPDPDPDPDDQPFDKQNTPNEPFVYGWGSGASEGEVYRVVIEMTNDLGCTEQTERYVVADSPTCPSSTVTQSGASTGAGIESNPWVFDAGDTITVNEPAVDSIANVKFDLFENATDVVILSTTDATAPYGGAWVNQTDNVIYRLEMAVTFTGGCTQTIIRYIKDEPPPVCSGAGATVSGDVSGNTGEAQGTPWTLNGGDSITITAPSGGTINQVAFTVTPVSPAGAALPVVTDSSAPFTYSWSDQTDNTVYSVAAVITYASGCTETVTRYVTDEVCSGATTAATGSSGAGTGLTSASPWVFNAGDKVTVTGPAGVTPTNVNFLLELLSDGTDISTSDDATAPFELTWSDQTDNTVYKLTITLTYTAGCTETLTRYIQDQGECFITVGTPVITHADSGAQRVASITYTITNPEAEALTIEGIKVSWARDAGHPVAVLQDIIFTQSATSTTQTMTATQDDPPNTGVINPLTTAPPSVPASSSSYTVKVRFDIGKKTDVIDLSSSWISGLCLQYTAPSFGGSTASCNVLGSTSGNPTTCN